jgi:hypothetical protein
MNFNQWFTQFDNINFSVNENTINQLLKQYNKNPKQIKILAPYNNLPNDELNILKKWMTYQIIQNKQEPNIYQPQLDVLFSNKSVFKKLNNPEFNLTNLQQENEKYHQLLKKHASSIWEGEVRHLNLSLNGLEWVSLDTDYNEEYGNSMGHCGNVARTNGDNIFSPKTNIHYLTFISDAVKPLHSEGMFAL